MISSSEIKDKALAALKGNWTDAVIATIMYGVIVGACPAVLSYMTSGAESVWTLLMLPLGWGFMVMFLNMMRGSKIDFTSMFDGYKDFVRIFVTLLLRYIYIILWTLLLIVPGIVKSLSYAMTDYIMKDDPEIKNNEAIEKSMAMMQGHKWELFLMYLSFIGWFILAVLTCFIGFIFLVPYMEAATAAFYEELKEEEANG